MSVSRALALGGLLLIPLSLPAAAVVVNANVQLSGPVVMGGGLKVYTLTIYQNESASDYTGLLFHSYATNTGSGPFSRTNWTVVTAYDSYLDEGLDAYRASTGHVFTAATLTTNAAFQPFLLSPDPIGYNGSITNLDNSRFYLALNTGLGGTPRNVFGWALFQTRTGVVTMVSNAMAYGYAGITVGTTDVVPIPEPGPLPLTTLFGALAALRLAPRTRR